MPDISSIVIVTVTKTTAAIDRAAFGTPMGVFQIPVATQAGRFALYSTTAELLAAGFSVNSEPYKWATIVKAQNPAPQRFALGRRVEGTAQVDTVTITGADAGTWSIDIDGVTFSYVAGASDTADTIAEGLRLAVSLGDPEPVDVIVPSSVTAGAFTVTARVAGTTFTNGGIAVGGAGSGTFTNTVANAAAEDMATCLAAIDAEDSKRWFIVTIESREDADITALQSFVSSRDKMAVAQSSDADARDGVDSNIFDTMQALNPDDLVMMWHADDRNYLDAGVASILTAAQLDNAGGAITLHGKQVSGVPTDDLSSGEVANIAGDGETDDGYGGNVHVEIAGRGFIMYGKAASGEFADVEQTILWTKARTAEDVFGAIATTPTKVPYTNAGISVVAGKVKGRLDRGVTNGHFSPDEPPTVTYPKSTEVDEADKNARVLRNVIGNAKLAGAIHKAYVQVNVTV